MIKITPLLIEIFEEIDNGTFYMESDEVISYFLNENKKSSNTIETASFNKIMELYEEYSKDIC